MKKVLWLAVCAALLCGGIMQADLVAARADGGGRNKDVEIRVRIALTGAAINGIRPEGHAEFRTAGAQRQLNVEVEHVNLADGTVVSVLVNARAVGMIKLVLGHGELELNSKNGAAVPAIQKGDVVTVTNSTGATILTGRF